MHNFEYDIIREQTACYLETLNYCQTQSIIFYNQAVIAMWIILELRPNSFHRAQRFFNHAFKNFIRMDRPLEQFLCKKIMWSKLTDKKYKVFTILFHEIKDEFDRIFFKTSLKRMFTYFDFCYPDNIRYSNGDCCLYGN